MKVKEPELLKGVIVGAILYMSVSSLIPPYKIGIIIFDFVVGIPVATLIGYPLAKFLKRHRIFYK